MSTTSTDPLVTEPGMDFDATPKDMAVATGSSYPEMTDLQGCLMVMNPYKHGTRVSKTDPTKTYPWVECDVYVLELPRDARGEHGWPTDYFLDEEVPFSLPGFQFSGVHVTGFLMQRLRKKGVGVGILEIGEKTDKSRSAPWLLQTPTPEQIRKAGRFWEALKNSEQESAESKRDQEYFEG